VYKICYKATQNHKKLDETEENLIVKILSTEYDKKDESN